MVAEVGGMTLLTKKKSASSGRSETRFRIRKSNCQVRGDQVLLLVKLSNPGLWGPLDDDWNSVWVLPPDFLPLTPPLLEGMLFLVLPLHLRSCLADFSVCSVLC